MVREAPFDIPADRFYDRAHHLWALPEGGRVRVGIDEIGLESLGDLAYVELRDAGTALLRGESLGTLEAAKMTSSINAPISGTIVRRNEAVLADPRIVNGDPYAAGWLVEIEPTDWERESADLVSGDAIGPWAVEESDRVRADQRGA